MTTKTILICTSVAGTPIGNPVVLSSASASEQARVKGMLEAVTTENGTPFPPMDVSYAEFAGAALPEPGTHVTMSQDVFKAV